MLTGSPDRVKEQIKPYSYRRNELVVKDSCLMWENRMITNSFLQNSMLHELYDNHPGIPCMRTLAISYAWWRPIDMLLEQKVKICNSCINESTKTPICPWKNQLAL